MGLRPVDNSGLLSSEWIHPFVTLDSPYRQTGFTLCKMSVIFRCNVSMLRQARKPVTHTLTHILTHRELRYCNTAKCGCDSAVPVTNSAGYAASGYRLALRVTAKPSFCRDWQATTAQAARLKRAIGKESEQGESRPISLAVWWQMRNPRSGIVRRW